MPKSNTPPADIQPFAVTIEDVRNPTLLARALRIVSDNLTAINTRLNAVVEQVKTIAGRLSLSVIQTALQANGSNPLNITALRGVAGDPQLAGVPRYDTVPTGLLLQSIRDTQIILVKNTTNYDLYMVLGGSPNTLTKLISGLNSSTGFDNMMTLNTAQVVVAAGKKIFREDAATTGTPQRSIHVVGTSGQVAAFPTLLAADAIVLENNGNAGLAFAVGPAGLGGIDVYGSGDGVVRGAWYYDRSGDTWNLIVAGFLVLSISGSVFSANSLAGILSSLSCGALTATGAIKLGMSTIGAGGTIPGTAGVYGMTGSSCSLPASPAPGTVLCVQDATGTASGGSPFTINGNGHNILAAGSITITKAYGSYLLDYTGAIWQIIGAY